MRTKNKRLLVIVAAAVLILSLLPALTLTAATDEDYGTQREYVVAMIKAAGMQDSLIGTVVRDQDMLAESLGFLDNWNYNPTATVTEEIAAAMDLAMADAKNGLRDALAKDPPEPYFVHGMAQPIFPYGNSTYYDTSGEGLVRFLVYVETDYDTDGDGKLDLIKVMVQLPRAAVEKGMKCASIYHAQPYNEGTNDGVSYPENVRAEGQAWLNANGSFDHELLHAVVPPRTPAGEITTKQLVDNQLLSSQPWRDWRYNYSYAGKPATTATVTWGVTNGNQISSLNMHDYFAVRGYALISTAGIGTLAGDGISTYGADIEIAAYAKVIEWLNGDAVAYTDKTSNIQIKADWSNGFAGMTGTSYGGTVPNGVASTGVKGLETIIPVCGIISYYEYQNQQGAANWGAQYTPGMVWYILSSFGRPDWTPTNPVRNRQMGYMQQMYWEAMDLNNQYGDHWARRDYSLDGWFKDWGPSKLHASMLIVHGTNDNNVRPKQSILMYEACKKAGVDVKFIWDQGAHMTPTNHQIGPYVYQEWQNLWYSKYLYKIDNDVLDLLPEVYAQSNLTGDYEGYDTWHSVNKLVLTNKDRVTTSPIAAPVPDREYEVPVEYDGPDLYLTGGIPPSGETEAVSTTAANDPPPPPAITGADDPFTLINSASGSSSWQNMLNVPTAASSLYSIVLPEDVTVKGNVAVNFRAAIMSAGSNVLAANNATTNPSGSSPTGQARVHARLVEIAAAGTTLRTFGGNAVGDSPATSTVLSGGILRGGGLSSLSITRFNPTTNLTYREIARGWMSLAHPDAGWASNTATPDKRLDIAANFGVYHDYTLYLQPCVHTAKKGNRLALIISTGHNSTQAYTGTNAFTFSIDNEASNVVIPIEFSNLPAKPVTIEVADVTGKPGGTVDVSYKISGNTSGFSTIDLSVPYDGNIYTPSAVKAVADLNTPLFVVNPVYKDNLMKIVFASRENVVFDGLLFTVTYQIAATAPGAGEYPLNLEVTKLQYGSFTDAMIDLETKVNPGTLVLGIMGDINGDGIITPEDAIILLQMYVGLIPWTNRALIFGDVNGDGIIDSTDAALILRMVVGG